MSLRSKDIRNNVLKIINSHTNVSGLILISFYNLSWEFHPLHPFAHWLGPDVHHMCPSGSDICPGPSSTTLTAHWVVPTEGWAGSQLWIHCLCLSFLLARLHPKLSSSMEVNLGYWRWCWVCVLSAAFAALPLPCSASTREVTSAAAILRLPVSGDLKPNCFSAFLQSWEMSESTFSWLQCPRTGLPSFQPPEMTLPLGSSKNCPLSLSLQPRHSCGFHLLLIFK